MIPKKNAVKDSHIVKIAVQFPDHDAQLINLDQRQPLTGKIQEICNNWSLTDYENYALQFCEPNNHRFVTEKNRTEIKNGSVLQLQLSPSKKASDILHCLKPESKTNKVKCLKELSGLSADLTFALEFIKEQGLAILISMIEVCNNEDDCLKYSLASFVELMEHGTVSWEILQTRFVTKNILIVCDFANYATECVERALSILENIVQNSGKYMQVENGVTFEHILRLLQESNSIVIRQNTIALTNALFMKANEQRKRQIALTFSKKQYRSVLIADVKGTEIQHQLYIFQTLTLGLLENRLQMKVNSQDQDAFDKIKELKKIAFDDYPIVSGTTEDQRRGGNVNFSQYYKKLGFKCDYNPVLDFIESPPGILALDCMAYFAHNYAQQYTKIIHENTCRVHEHECPFARTSIELVKMLCEFLRIGEPPSEYSTNFHPMLFTHDHPFEEFFCICIITLNRTWKDMRATAEDFQKVLSVVREQINRTLKIRPENLEDFRFKIGQLNYQAITNLRQQERTSKEECESTAFAIVKLKEKISPEVILLIKQQRLAYLVEGTRFSKYSRGVRSKDKFWYARLSPNHKVIHYGDCDEKAVPNLEELTNKVVVIDIKQLLVGKECPHMKEMRARKSAANLGFSITFDNMDHSTLDFVASEELVFHYWTDGINALLGQNMTSKQKEEDFEILLSMKIKLRLLDTEGVDISNVHPAVPDDPPNYDFCFEN